MPRGAQSLRLCPRAAVRDSICAATPSSTSCIRATLVLNGWSLMRFATRKPSIVSGIDQTTSCTRSRAFSAACLCAVLQPPSRRATVCPMLVCPMCLIPHQCRCAQATAPKMRTTRRRRCTTRPTTRRAARRRASGALMLCSRLSVLPTARCLAHTGLSRAQDGRSARPGARQWGIRVSVRAGGPEGCSGPRGARGAGPDERLWSERREPAGGGGSSLCASADSRRRGGSAAEGAAGPGAGARGAGPAAARGQDRRRHPYAGQPGCFGRRLPHGSDSH
eukprot:COSAG04_NODE_357_length_16031_cov_6.453427_7_plen_278_part_00